MIVINLLAYHSSYFECIQCLNMISFEGTSCDLMSINVNCYHVHALPFYMSIFLFCKLEVIDVFSSGLIVCFFSSGLIVSLLTTCSQSFFRNRLLDFELIFGGDFLQLFN